MAGYTGGSRCHPGRLVHWAALGLILLIGESAILPAHAGQDDKDAVRKELDRRRSKARFRTADTRYKLGKWLESRKTFANAKREYEAAVREDPSHEAAQRKLGRVKDRRTGEFRFNAKVARSSRAMTRQNEKIGREMAEIRSQYEIRRKRMGKTLAKVLLKYGMWCREHGFMEEAWETLRKGLKYDPDNAALRKALYR